MQLVPGFDRSFQGSAASGYLKVGPFDLHRDGPAARVRSFAPAPNFISHRDHACFDPCRVGQALREGCLRTRRLSFAIGQDRSIISASRDLEIPTPRLAEVVP